MERNLNMTKSLPHLPTRFCWKIAGPGESSLIANAISAMNGNKTMSAKVARVTSISLLATGYTDNSGTVSLVASTVSMLSLDQEMGLVLTSITSCPPRNQQDCLSLVYHHITSR